jgi:hypothetical protein
MPLQTSGGNGQLVIPQDGVQVAELVEPQLVVHEAVPLQPVQEVMSPLTQVPVPCTVQPFCDDVHGAVVTLQPVLLHEPSQRTFPVTPQLVQLAT